MDTTDHASAEHVRSIVEKGGGGFAGIRMLLCENPLPPLDAAVEAARAELPRGNLYTEAFSGPLRRLIGARSGPRAGTVTDLAALPDLLRDRPDTMFLVDEAFVGMGAPTVAPLVAVHANLVVTRTMSKAQSLAGLRIGYAFCPPALAADLNASNDAYPLARPSQAAAIATLQRPHEIAARAGLLRGWAGELAAGLRQLGVRTFPSETYFFLADFAPHDARAIADELLTHGVLLKPLGDARLGRGMIRVTTALPEDNARVLGLLARIL